MPSKPHLEMVFDTVADWPRLARQLGVPYDQVTLNREKTGALVERVWLEVPITEDWTSAARLAVQNGQLVVAELRIFPNEPGRQLPGLWSAELLGARARVPPGGLTSRMLRRVRLTEHPKHTRAVLASGVNVRRAGADVHVSAATLLANPVLGRALPGLNEPGGRPRPERRSGRPDRFYARLAADYARLIERGGRRPVVELARRHEVKPPRMRDMIREARERGLLTFFTQGRPGGALTPRARVLLGEQDTATSKPMRQRGTRR